MEKTSGGAALNAATIERALFVDRDGIFNDLVPWGGGLGAPRNWNEVRFLKSIEGIERVKPLGYRLIMVTNQPDVERGLIDVKFVEELNDHYEKKFQLDAVYACLNASNDHPMKKPNPGMLLAAASRFHLKLEESFFLGDTDKDLGAARNVNCRFILWDRPYNQTLKPDFRIASISELINLLP